MNYSKVLGIVFFVLLIFVASAMFFAQAWASGLLMAIAGAILHPAVNVEKARYRWAIVAVLLLAAIWFVPDDDGRLHQQNEGNNNPGQTRSSEVVANGLAGHA